MRTHLYSKLTAGMLTTVCVLSVVSFAFAEDTPSASTTNRRPGQAIRQEIKDIRASSTAEIRDLRDQVKETRIDIKAKLTTKKQLAVLKVISNRVRAFEKIINQQKDRANRVAAVAAKIKAQGKDTSIADAALLDAQTKLADGLTKLASIKTTASSTVASSTPGQTLNAVKDIFNQVKEDIKTAHKDIARAISSLKGIGYGKVDRPATTTLPVATTTNATTTATTTVATSTASST